MAINNYRCIIKGKPIHLSIIEKPSTELDKTHEFSVSCVQSQCCMLIPTDFLDSLGLLCQVTSINYPIHHSTSLHVCWYISATVAPIGSTKQ